MGTQISEVNSISLIRYSLLLKVTVNITPSIFDSQSHVLQCSHNMKLLRKSETTKYICDGRYDLTVTK